MDIRKAGADDIKTVLKMALKFVNLTDYKDYADSEEMGLYVASFLVGNPHRVIFLYEDTAMLAAMLNPVIFGKTLLGTEAALWVEPEARANGIARELIKTYEGWVKENNGKLCSVCCLDDELGRFYEKLGYKLYERSYLKCL